MAENYYCENDECRVELYSIMPSSDHANCPGCGRMGRKKGKQ